MAEWTLDDNARPSAGWGCASSAGGVDPGRPRPRRKAPATGQRPADRPIACTYRPRIPCSRHGGGRGVVAPQRRRPGRGPEGRAAAVAVPGGAHARTGEYARGTVAPASPGAPAASQPRPPPAAPSENRRRCPPRTAHRARRPPRARAPPSCASRSWAAAWPACPPPLSCWTRATRWTSTRAASGLAARWPPSRTRTATTSRWARLGGFAVGGGRAFATCGGRGPGGARGLD